MDLSDEELVSCAQEGDQWAMDELIRRYRKKTYAMAFQMCSGDRHEAQDITQEIFLKAFRNIKTFRGQSSFYTWFYRIAVNTCLDQRKRSRRWKRIFSFWNPVKRENERTERNLEEHADPDHHQNPLDVLTHSQLSIEIQTAMKKLPDHQRMALQLKLVQGMSIREIAQVMDLAEGTVKSHLFRATQFMRKALKKWA